MMLPTQPGDAGAAYYSDTWPGDIPVDIARNKAATGDVYWYLIIFVPIIFAPVQTVTRSYACVKTSTECWCSGIWNTKLTINLGKSYNVNKVRITPNPTMEANFVGVAATEIHVGPNGAAGDPQFGTIASAPAPGTTVSVYGNGTGQYITIIKKSGFLDFPGICLCSVEAFGQ